MLFTLWGVFIRHFDSEIPLSAVLRLLGEFGFTEAAARVAIGRLAEQGWVELRRDGRSRILSMTDQGFAIVDEAANRIYRHQREQWDGHWLLLTYTIPEGQRAARDQLRTDLAWWGFGALGSGTWLSPHPLSPALALRLKSPEIAPYVDYFRARYTGPHRNADLVVKGWQLGEVAAKYRHFLDIFGPEFAAAQAELPSERDCFVKRCRLVHEYRKFLFVDPGLPEELLAEEWPGGQAFDLFYAYDQLLGGPAASYFYGVYTGSGGLPLTAAALTRSFEAASNPFGSTGTAAPAVNYLKVSNGTPSRR